MSEEKIVKINDIPISNTGFTNLQFETSKSSNSVNTIRGFGSLFNEENLSIIQTVSMDFDLKASELENLALIYSLFRACGILPIENEYLLKKISSTYTQSKSKSEIKKDEFVKDGISHLVCLLERINMNSLEKTSDGYKVNLVLTLYDSPLSKPEFDKYIEILNKDDTYKTFENHCKSEIANCVRNLSNKSKSGLTLDVYNIEKLNAKYKKHIISNATVNKKLNKDTEIENEVKANEMYDKNKMSFLEKEEAVPVKDKDGNNVLDKNGNIMYVDPYAPTKISIENKHILQIEFITHNKISNLPLLGSPIFTKSYLGIGESFFNVKCIFREDDEGHIAQQLKAISDKNIINHKVELYHPLVQMFDFHSANIVNIVFNNLEQANGIMVNITFSLNGFRYAEEDNINIDEILNNVEYKNDEKQELIGGLYLEHLLDYLYNNKNVISEKTMKSFLSNVLETKTFDSSGNMDDIHDAGLLTHSYSLASLFASYSSFPSSYGTHKQIGYEVHGVLSVLSGFDKTDFINDIVNKDVKTVSKKAMSSADFFLLNYKSAAMISDSDLNPWRALSKGENYYALVDNVVLVSLFANDPYKNYIKDRLYGLKRLVAEPKILVNVIRNCVAELFNSKQNFTIDLTSSVIRKIYEEFLFRLFYIVDTKEDSGFSFSEDVKNYDFFFTHDGKISFNSIHYKINYYCERIYSLFIKSLNDSNFIERITREAIVEFYDPVEKLKIDAETTVKEISKEVYNFELEFTTAYEKNKSIIVDRAYNIFLTKYLYLVSVYICDKNPNRRNPINFEKMLKAFILSSSLHSILLARTPERTDHFDNHIILGVKNIGYKISLYNQKLYKITEEKDGTFSNVNILFSEIFKGREPNEYNFDTKNSYYLRKLTVNDIYYLKHNLFNDNVQKDINFFYGKLLKNKFNDFLHYVKDVEKDATVKKDLSEFFDEERMKFITNRDLSYANYDDTKNPYSYSDLDTDEFDFPLLHGGSLPSSFKKYFFNYRLMNDRMKQRLIASKDPFKDLQNLTDIVYDFNNYVIPDYDVMICKKYQFMNSTSGEEMVGNAYKKINNRAYLMLKNVSSISIVKNPKTKIKVAKVILNDVTKSIFNFDPFNGSFDLKTLHNEKVDIIHVEPGDEIRVRLGYGKNIQVFNGFIQEITGSSNQIALSCSSFASGLYSEAIEKLTIKSNISGWTNNFRKIKTSFESFKSTLEKISPEAINTIKNYFYSIRPINAFLFKELNNNHSNYNVPFVEEEQSSMYSSFVLALQTVSNRVLTNFTPRNILNITSGSLSHDSYIKASLKSVFGSISLPNEVIGASPDLLVNINNIDTDYDAYGLMPSHEAFHEEYMKDRKEKEDAEKKKNDVDNSILNNGSPNDFKESDYGIDVAKPTEFGLQYYPMSLSYNCKITSLFLERRINKKTKKVRNHGGIDILNHSHKIFAVGDGKVIKLVQFTSVPTGLAIYIEHKIPNSDKTFVSAYFHLNKIHVKENEICKAGQYIADMGNTGRSFGAHLHFEMFTNDPGKIDKKEQINPFAKGALPYVDPEKLKKIISWNEVNILADNGQYSEALYEKYYNCKKYKEYRGIK